MDQEESQEEDTEESQELEEVEQVEEPEIEQPRKETPPIDLNWKMEAADFADAIKAVEAVVAYGLEAKETPEVMFKVDADGIQVTKMDKARVGMVMFDLKKHGFEEFTVKTPGMICFDAKDITSVLKGVKRTTRDDDGTIKVEGDKLNLQIKDVDMTLDLSGNSYDRTWNLRAIEPESESEVIPEPKISYTAKFVTVPSKLKRLLSDAALTGTDHITISADNNEVVIKAKEEDTSKSFTGKIPRETGLLALEIQEPATAIYNLGFLLNIINNVPKTAETVAFSFARDSTCRAM